MAKHKRGGFYTFRLMENITNWCGVLLDREILNHLIIGDVVRIICETPLQDITYVEITDILPNGYFKGKIHSTYRGTYCNICGIEGDKKNYLHSCNGYNDNLCNFHCHLKCLKKNPEYKKCNCCLKRFYLQQNEVVIFKKNNISEIPNWTPNTAKLNEIYVDKNNVGYQITGMR